MWIYQVPWRYFDSTLDPMFQWRIPHKQFDVWMVFRQTPGELDLVQPENPEGCVSTNSIRTYVNVLESIVA